MTRFALQLAMLAVVTSACSAGAVSRMPDEVPTRTVDSTTFTGKQVRGRLAPEQIRSVVVDNLDVFRRCYEDARRVTPKLQGKVTVKFEIDPDGTVTRSADARSDLPDDSVVQCVIGAYRTLRFPKPDRGIVTVYFPLIFNPRD